MIALFLGTELASIRHGPRLRELLDGHGLPEHIVVAPDLTDPTESARRRQLLDMYRGYDSRVGLFAGFPNDVRWEWVTLTPSELLRVKYIDYDYWVELSGGSRVAADAPARIRAGAAPFGVRSDWAISFAETFAAGTHFPPLILVTSGPTNNLVVLEGNARLTTYAMRPDALPSELEVMLGTSSQMGHWGLY
jgi:hypothetical protein